MTYFLGIDASTTATKALLMRADGEVLAVSSSEYTYETPQPLWTEQHPELWWQGSIASIRQVLAQFADIHILFGCPGYVINEPHIDRFFEAVSVFVF